MKRETIPYIFWKKEYWRKFARTTKKAKVKTINLSAKSKLGKYSDRLGFLGTFPLKLPLCVGHFVQYMKSKRRNLWQ